MYMHHDSCIIKAESLNGEHGVRIAKNSVIYWHGGYVCEWWHSVMWAFTHLWFQISSTFCMLQIRWYCRKLFNSFHISSTWCIQQSSHTWWVSRLVCCWPAAKSPSVSSHSLMNGGDCWLQHASLLHIFVFLNPANHFAFISRCNCIFLAHKIISILFV